MNPVLEMRRRIRVHMMTSLGGVVLCFLTFAVGGGIAHAVGMGHSGAAVGLVALAAIAMIPALGFWSTFRNLRCPSCNGMVAWQVSNKFSAFGSMASNECRHCGVTIFAPNATRRFFLAIGLIAVVFFLFAAGMSGYMAQRNRAAQPPASSGP
jgi:hypothetical protein